MIRLTKAILFSLILFFWGIHDVYSASPSDEALIELGEHLFNNETFDGNGRTCATCHRPENNFTIDPKFIATLPSSDPLFVHENNPHLKDLENAELLRKFGLFLENVDGFDRPGVFRGVPHNLALRTSIEHYDEAHTLEGVHALGWSGDGSAEEGSLRTFAIGAIIQHFPKKLRRKVGKDFRLPTEHELDALEAFQLSLGRQEDIQLAQMNFKSATVNKGRDLFFDQKSGPCNFCHDNAGANTADGLGKNFSLGIEDMPNAPHKLEEPSAPYDAGLGQSAGDQGFGDNSFNTPALVEAADTAPFFHNNSIPTIEGAVAFYTSPVFKIATGMDVDLETSEVNAIAAMLRTINSLENIRISNQLDDSAKHEKLVDGIRFIELAMADTEDAYQVLEGMEYNLFEGAVDMLKLAYELEASAINANNESKRNHLLYKAISYKDKAKKLMVN
jgi:cytochrome c553